VSLSIQLTVDPSFAPFCLLIQDLFLEWKQAGVAPCWQEIMPSTCFETWKLVTQFIGISVAVFDFYP